MTYKSITKATVLFLLLLVLSLIGYRPEKVMAEETWDGNLQNHEHSAYLDDYNPWITIVNGDGGKEYFIVELKKYTGSSSTPVIPEETQIMGITAKVYLDWDVYDNCDYITSVTIKNAYINFNDRVGAKNPLSFTNDKKLVTADLRGVKFEGAQPLNQGIFDFSNCSSLVSVNMDGVVTNQIKFLGNPMFQNCVKLTSLSMANWDTSKVYSFGSWFFGCEAVTDSVLAGFHLERFDTSSLERMGLLAGIPNITKIVLRDYGWNTSKLVQLDMGGNFSLKTADLSGCDLSKVAVGKCPIPEKIAMQDDKYNLTGHYGMFGWDYELESVDFSGTNFGTNAEYGVELNGTFYNCYKLKRVDLSECKGNINASTWTFGNCKSLEYIDMSNMKIDYKDDVYPYGRIDRNTVDDFLTFEDIKSDNLHVIKVPYSNTPDLIEEWYYRIRDKAYTWYRLEKDGTLVPLDGSRDGICVSTKSITYVYANHNNDVIKKGTFNSTGYRSIKCSKCGGSYYEKIPKVTVKFEYANFWTDGKGNEFNSIYIYAEGKELEEKYYTKKDSLKGNVQTTVITLKGDYFEGQAKLVYDRNKDKLTVTGIDDWKNVEEKVVAPKTTIKKLTAKKKSMIVSWTKKKNVSFYQVQLSTDKSFAKKYCKTVKFSSKSSQGTIKKLISKKKYYVRIRTAIKKNGKTYYSKWSAVKSVKVK